MENFGNMMGALSALCIAVYLIPQCVHMFKTKSSAGLSILTVLFAIVGDIAGVFHMFIIIDYDIWLLMRTLVVMVASIILTFLFFKYRNK